MRARVAPGGVASVPSGSVLPWHPVLGCASTCRASSRPTYGEPPGRRATDAVRPSPWVVPRDRPVPAAATWRRRPTAERA
ncbi:hypothetical protein FTX61_17540 [Nitriliruptoraceae bacterium ZYF776]|nr:hypothetical protein [Profundirhabdus halotolerans]